VRAVGADGGFIARLRQLRHFALAFGAGGAHRDRAELVVAGEPVHLEDEHHRADLDAVPGAEDGLALHAVAVQVGPVGAAEVFQPQAVAVAHHAAVLAGDLAQRDAQVAVLAAADHGHVTNDGKATPFPVRPKHYEYRLHSDLPWNRVSLRCQDPDVGAAPAAARRWDGSSATYVV
jgi:hypothetical protein